MSRKKTNVSEDPFASIPPRESFEAFPASSAFPETAIAFLTGKASQPGAMPSSLPVEDDIRPHTKPVRQETKQQDKPSEKPTTQPSPPQPATQDVPKPVSPSVAAPVSDDEHEPAALSVTPSTDLPTTPTTSPAKDLSSDQSGSLAQSRTGFLEENPSQSHALSLTPGITLGRLKVSDRLNANQRRVLDLLLAVKPYIIKFRDIADALDMREASVRTILRRLEALSFLTFQKARDGNIQGVRVAFNQQLVEQYQQDQTISQSSGLPLSKPQRLYSELAYDSSSSQTPAFSQSQPVTRSDNQPETTNTSFQKERKENLSIESFEDWDDAFLELMWPNVHEAGLRMDQISQAAGARAKLGKPLERDLVTLSLDRAQWELEVKGQLVNLTTGEKVRNVAAYVFTALARWGALRAHPEYVSREEEQAKAAADEIRRRKEAADNLETARFERYLAGLSKEEMEAAMQGFPGGSKDAWLKNHWRKHVRDAS